MEIVCILSTTVLPLDGIYARFEVVGEERQNVLGSLQGVPHYIGHPDTKALIETLGAVPAPTKLFSGLKPGESALCFPLVQGESSRSQLGFNSPHQAIESIEKLSIVRLTMLGRTFQEAVDSFIPD